MPMMTTRQITLLVSLLAIALLAALTACSGKSTKPTEDNPWAGAAVNGAGASNTGANWTNRGTGNDSSGGTGDAGTEQATRQNDTRISDAIGKAKREFESGDYTKALGRLQAVATLEPRSDGPAANLAEWIEKVSTWSGAFAGITPIGTRDNYVRVVFHGGGTVIGFLIEEDTRKKTLLIRRTIGGFETISTAGDDFAEVQKIPADKQKRELKDTYDRIEYEFEQAKDRSASDFFRFAQTAWRYGEKVDAHRYLGRAWEIDPDISDTVKMEADEDYAAFRAASARNDLAAARDALRRLRWKFPNAELFKEARAELGMMVAVAKRNATQSASGGGNDGPGETDVDPKVAASIFANINRQAEKAGAQAQTEVVIAKSAGSDLAREMQGSVEDVIAAGDRHYQQAAAFDAQSRPGERNADLLLEKAVYHYRCAQDLYKKALDRGASADSLSDRQVLTNKGLFWCRKRMPLH
ncbi:MAG: hypothetical protein AB7S36_10405 [Planctomycetota bacterium]